MKYFIMAATCMTLVACSGNVRDYDRNAAVPVSQPIVKPQPIQQQQRILVQRVGVLQDDIAYGGIRGTYVIIDTKTGKEYIGVSGIGITEVGEHNNGKASYTDER